MEEEDRLLIIYYGEIAPRTAALVRAAVPCLLPELSAIIGDYAAIPYHKCCGTKQSLISQPQAGPRQKDLHFCIAWELRVNLRIPDGYIIAAQGVRYQKQDPDNRGCNPAVDTLVGLAEGYNNAMMQIGKPLEVRFAYGGRVLTTDTALREVLYAQGYVSRSDVILDVLK